MESQWAAGAVEDDRVRYCSCSDEIRCDLIRDSLMTDNAAAVSSVTMYLILFTQDRLFFRSHMGASRSL